MNLPDFGDWPSLRGSSVRTGGSGPEDDDSIEMAASVASAAANGDEEGSWHDDDGGDGEDDENVRRRRRGSRRRRRITRRRCCPSCNCTSISCCSCSCSCACTQTLLQPGSSPGAVANLCSATLGAGVLSLPYAICRCGVVPGLLLLGLAATSTIVSIDMIIETGTTLGLSSYEEMTRRLLGPKALVVVESSIFVFCFGCAVAYVVAVGDILQQGILGVFAAELPAFVTREWTMAMFWMVVMLPLSLLERIDSLRFASVFGIGSIAFLVVACVVHSVRDWLEIRGDGENSGGGGGGSSDDSATNGTFMYADVSHGPYMYDESDDHYAAQDVRWWTPSSFWDVVLACPIIMFAFSCQVNVCAIYEELGGRENDGSGDAAADLTRTRRRGNVSGPSHHGGSSRKADRMASVTRTAVAVCVLFYSLIGTFAYVDFGERTADNVLKNYNVQETHDPMMIGSFVCITIAVVMAFPLNVFPARATLEGVARRLLVGNEGGHGGDNIGSSEGVESEGEDALGRPLLEEDGIGEQGSPVGAIPDAERPSSRSSRPRHIVLTLIISGGALLTALVVPDISVVFGIMGGTASSVICFIFPGLFVVKMKQAGDDDDPPHQPPTLWRTIQAWILILGGSLIGILSTCVTLYNVFT